MTLPDKNVAALAANAADRLLQKVALSYIDPHDLKLYDRELRIHTPKQLDKIAGAMRAFGFVDPVLVGQNNKVIDGSARVAVAIRLGINPIPQIVIGHLNETEQRMLRLCLNRLQQLGEFNMKELRVELLQLSTIDIAHSIELTGFDHVEIDNIISQPPPIRARPIPPTRIFPRLLIRSRKPAICGCSNPTGCSADPRSMRERGTG